MPLTQTLEFRLYVGHMERRKEVSTLMRWNRRECRFCSNIARITFCSTPLKTDITTLALLSHRVKLEPFCVLVPRSSK